MGDEQRQALARLFAEDEVFKAAMLGAASVEEAMRIAREHGVDATVEDFAVPRGDALSESELEGTAGGTYTGEEATLTFTDSVAGCRPGFTAFCVPW